jgi:integrase
MSVFKHPRSPFYQYDQRWRGHRIFGSTKQTNRRQAEAVARTEIELEKQRILASEHARISLRIDDIGGRYWQEVGQHHANARDTWRELGRLITFFGKDKLLTDITGNDVARLVAWRRGQRIGISPFTVNDTTEMLRRLFTRAGIWGVRFSNAPRWRDHLLKEPQERVRELAPHEAVQIEAVTRDDLAPFFAFARASGLRLNECLLKWSEVDRSTREIRKLGKGGHLVKVPITSTIREIIWPLQGHHPEHVFTFVADRTFAGRIKGRRYPLTYHGARGAWWQMQKRSGVVGFRFHDLRHDLATKLLRETGNLKLVQRALNHRDIKTTTKYAHVVDREVADALERVTASHRDHGVHDQSHGRGGGGAPVDKIGDADSRNGSRNKIRSVK